MSTLSLLDSQSRILWPLSELFSLHDIWLWQHVRRPTKSSMPTTYVNQGQDVRCPTINKCLQAKIPDRWTSLGRFGWKFRGRKTRLAAAPFRPLVMSCFLLNDFRKSPFFPLKLVKIAVLLLTERGSKNLDFFLCCILLSQCQLTPDWPRETRARAEPVNQPSIWFVALCSLGWIRTSAAVFMQIFQHDPLVQKATLNVWKIFCRSFPKLSRPWPRKV